ncbi:hypothetical protein PFISCL1PPCAC_14864 [Pristionchus fissidentatus]|uniref:F-box domain-containing protein n=1 Tax=Pristionchus fissidentatus TaxID=1538716 RepID=A0AAV5VXY7_9BILA|nr:hypothetical protein PFISCL1PPCAC_14864 [Pristionchus fissidentatus]
MESLPPEILSFLLHKLDRISLVNASLTSPQFRNNVIRNHFHFAFSPIIGIEIRGNSSSSLSIRSSCKECSAHSSTQLKTLQESTINEDKTQFLSILSSILQISARSFDVSIIDVPSHFLSLIRDAFIDRSSLSTLPIRSLCIRSIKGSDESPLQQILQTFNKPTLIYLHIWNMATLQWNSKSMESASTVCLRSDVFAPLPSNLRVRPHSDTTDSMREEMKDSADEDEITTQLITEYNLLCEHKHLFQLTRMESDHPLNRLCESIDSAGKPLSYNALKYHQRPSKEKLTPKHRNFVLEFN